MSQPLEPLANLTAAIQNDGNFADDNISSRCTVWRCHRCKRKRQACTYNGRKLKNREEWYALPQQHKKCDKCREACDNPPRRGDDFVSICQEHPPERGEYKANPGARVPVNQQPPQQQQQSQGPVYNAYLAQPLYHGQSNGAIVPPAPPQAGFSIDATQNAANTIYPLLPNNSYLGNSYGVYIPQTPTAQPRGFGNDFVPFPLNNSHIYEGTPGFSSPLRGEGLFQPSQQNLVAQINTHGQYGNSGAAALGHNFFAAGSKTDPLQSQTPIIAQGKPNPRTSVPFTAVSAMGTPVKIPDSPLRAGKRPREVSSDSSDSARQDSLSHEIERFQESFLQLTPQLELLQQQPGKKKAHVQRHIRILRSISDMIDGYGVFMSGDTNSDRQNRYKLMRRGRRRMVRSSHQIAETHVEFLDNYVEKYERHDEEQLENVQSVHRQEKQGNPASRHARENTGSASHQRRSPEKQTLAKPRGRERPEIGNGSNLGLNSPPRHRGEKTLHRVILKSCKEDFDRMTREMMHDGRWSDQVEREDDRGDTPLGIAARLNLTDYIWDLIQIFGALADGAEDSKSTPLYQAVKHGCVEATVALVEKHGADKHKIGRSDGESAYSLAKRRRDINSDIKSVLGCPVETAYGNS